MWKSFFKWKSCLSKEKGKSMADEMLASNIEDVLRNLKKTSHYDIPSIFHVDFQQ